TRAEYLMWDAKELVPEAWEKVEHELDTEATGDDISEAIASPAAKAKALRQRKDLCKRLHDEVITAKATQVATIYQKHFPDEWDRILAKKSADDVVVDGPDFLAAHPRLLAKLTRNIYKTKFVALLRPDYGFGVGRKGIDLSKLVVSTKTSPYMDPQLLEQVADDLAMACPMENPEIWESFDAKLRPGQTLWDRHDLVLKMVKAIQLEKKRTGADGGMLEEDSPTRPSGEYNATEYDRDDASSRRGKPASS
ncbi:MAG: hypothetical protein SGARI_006730, partial [Bacillariaceae sp.]